MTIIPADGMPTTRGTNFYLADPNLASVCATVMAPDDFARARPHVVAMGEVAGGELDACSGRSSVPVPSSRWRRSSSRVWTA
jgi:hypothetical protein